MAETFKDTPHQFRQRYILGGIRELAKVLAARG